MAESRVCGCRLFTESNANRAVWIRLLRTDILAHESANVRGLPPPHRDRRVAQQRHPPPGRAPRRPRAGGPSLARGRQGSGSKHSTHTLQLRQRTWSVHFLAASAPGRLRGEVSTHLKSTTVNAARSRGSVRQRPRSVRSPRAFRSRLMAEDLPAPVKSR